VPELFICKTEIKICFERWLFHVNDWQWVLAIFHTKQVRAVSSSLKIGTWVLFYKAWHSSPLFLSQTMDNRFHRVPTNFHKPWRSAFFSFFLDFRLQWSDQLPCKINDKQMKHASRGVLNSIWKIAIPTTTSS
jgi:hypothetical protein